LSETSEKIVDRNLRDLVEEKFRFSGSCCFLLLLTWYLRFRPIKTDSYAKKKVDGDWSFGTSTQE